MSRWGVKAVEDALTDFQKIKRIIGDKDEFKRSFRARARDMPSSISLQLLPTMTYCYSQTKGRYGEIYGWIEEGTKPKEITKEAFAYGAFLYLMLKRLFPDARDPIKCFEEMVRANPSRLIFMKRKLLAYLLELKKFTEAEFEVAE